MLYVTTCSRRETYPALRPLGQERAPDGGLYLPAELPRWSRDEIEQLRDLDFGQITARVLCGFFGNRISGLDVNFSIGRQPVQYHTRSHRIVLAETWCNAHWDFGWAVEALTGRLRTEAQQGRPVTEWALTAVQTAMLFAMFGDLMRRGLAGPDQPVDVVSAGDFSGAMAARYASSMGLPVAVSVYASEENPAMWDLIHRGELKTGKSVPQGAERLIAHQLGQEEAERYRQISQKNGYYAPAPDRLEQLREGMFAAVVGKTRTDQVMTGLLRDSGLSVSREGAAAYAGLQDYRATTGESRTALLLIRRQPEDARSRAEEAGTAFRQRDRSDD